ncbi:hypothetical protein PAXRUDRAFT_155669, partial [Paxillus rubicundulus Ve08.2h10]
LRDIIPPDHNEVLAAMCALFIGSHMAVTQHNIAKPAPILVNKLNVHTISHFLIECNLWYRGQVVIAESNIEDLYQGDTASALPQAIELCCLKDMDNASGNSSYSDCSDHQQFHLLHNVGTVLIEFVGYTEADHSPMNYRIMKALALAHCLNGRRFLQACSGSNLVEMIQCPFLVLGGWN